MVLSSFLVSCDDSNNVPDAYDPIICKITVIRDGDADGTVSITNYNGTSANVLIGNQIEVVAAPAEGSAFIGWYMGNSNTPVSTEKRFVFTASENTTLIARIAPIEAIDLGLSVKWATCNVGANIPWEYGVYYAWGEREKKSYYHWSTYKWCKGSYDSLTKYCISSTNCATGKWDDKTVLDPEDDVAHVKWGGNWRMPTEAEQVELRKNCTWTWTTQNGVNGYEVTGPNGNSIFLPAAGYRDRTEAYDRGNNGYYWSSSLNYNGSACCLYFDSGEHGRGSYSSYYGLSVRPVSE